MPRLTSTRPTASEGIITLLVVASVVGVVAYRAAARRFGAHASAADCASLLDKYVDHLVAAEGGPLPVPARELAERRAKARAHASAQAALARCSSELTPDEVACGLRSTYADELERCLP